MAPLGLRKSVGRERANQPRRDARHSSSAAKQTQTRQPQHGPRLPPVKTRRKGSDEGHEAAGMCLGMHGITCGAKSKSKLW